MNIHNQSRGYRVAALIVSAIAAITMTACTTAEPSTQAKTAPATTSAPSPAQRIVDLSVRDPQIGDTLQLWSTGKEGSSAGFATKLGVPKLYDTQDDVAAQGFFAVGELGKYCVIGLSTAGADTAAGNVSVVVLSRYNDALDSANPNLSAEDAVKEAEHWRSACTSGKYVPDGTEIVNEPSTAVKA